jgi:hypothetical protein
MPHWGTVVREIQRERDTPNESGSDRVRTRYLSELNKHVGRNIICYYSGFLSKPRNIEGLEINDDDKNGFMECVHGLDRTKGLDLFLHTPGGEGAATESIVDYLKEMFGDDIRAFVPQIAMSAGTIIACACKSIFMGKQSNIGPVDPQVSGISAYAVEAALERAYQDIKVDVDKAYIWNPVLQNYTAGFLQRCEWAKEEARKMVTGYLITNMLKPKRNRRKKADAIYDWLAEISSNKGHDHHIHYKECIENGLIIELLENPKDKKLQDLVLTIHHCFMFSLSNTPAFKIIENHVGRRWMRLHAQIAGPMPFPMMPMVAHQPISPAGSGSPAH